MQTTSFKIWTLLRMLNSPLFVPQGYAVFFFFFTCHVLYFFLESFKFHNSSIPLHDAALSSRVKTSWEQSRLYQLFLHRKTKMNKLYQCIILIYIVSVYNTDIYYIFKECSSVKQILYRMMFLLWHPALHYVRVFLHCISWSYFFVKQFPNNPMPSFDP